MTVERGHLKQTLITRNLKEDNVTAHSIHFQDDYKSKEDKIWNWRLGKSNDLHSASVNS